MDTKAETPHIGRIIYKAVNEEEWGDVCKSLFCSTTACVSACNK